MKKGEYTFVDYLCDTNNELVREVNYESMGIKEMPWMKDEFVAWCVEQGMSERTAKSYASHLKSLDKDVFDDFAYVDEADTDNTHVEDFYAYLKVLFEKKRKAEIDTLFDDASALIGRFRPFAKDYNRGEDNVRDMASAFAKYRNFINEKFDIYHSVKEPEPTEENVFPFIDKFEEWMIKDGKLTPETAKYYLSYLASLNEQVLCKMTKSGKSPLLLLQGRSLKQGYSILEAIDGLYTSKRLDGKIPDITEKTLSNWASAFKKYKSFYASIALGADEKVDEEPVATETDEKVEIEKIEDNFILSDSDMLKYKPEDLFQRFQHRNYSQNRMSGKLKRFYLPGLLNTLFSKAKKKGDANWFTKWGEECFDGVDVIVSMDEKKVKLSSLTLIAISPISGDVYATLEDGTNVMVYTRTADKSIRKMSAKNLSGVTIDHVKPMKAILEDKNNVFESFDLITDMVKRVAKRSIKLSTAKEHKSITKLRKRIFATPKYQSEKEAFFNLIPQIKEDLRHLNNLWQLELMEKDENNAKSDDWEE